MLDNAGTTSNDQDELEVTLETNQTFEVDGMLMRLTRPLTISVYKEGDDECVVGKHIGLMLEERAETTNAAILKLIRNIVLENKLGQMLRPEEGSGYQRETFNAIDGLIVPANDHEV
jgi:hypothetical protein